MLFSSFISKPFFSFPFSVDFVVYDENENGTIRLILCNCLSSTAKMFIR